MIVSQRTRERDGAAAVEFAIVSIVFFMFFFGIVEFAQLVYLNNLLDSAAREGARYAAVHTDDGSALTTNTQNAVMERLAGLQTRFQNFNPNTSIVVRAVDPETGAQLYDTYGAVLPPEDTAFGQFIRVEITGVYRPLMTGMLGLPVSLDLTGTAVINSEAN